MVQSGSGPVTAQDVVASLEVATVGSRTLDLKIAYAVKDGELGRNKLMGILLEEGRSWDFISQFRNAEVPCYSTSLDANLPGENIVATIYSASRSRWAAIHKAEDGGETVVWAATEPLARRLAVLRARLVTATGAVEPRERPAELAVFEPSSTAARAAEPAPAESGQTAEPTDEDRRHGDEQPEELEPADREWTIRF